MGTNPTDTLQNLVESGGPLKVDAHGAKMRCPKKAHVGVLVRCPQTFGHIMNVTLGKEDQITFLFGLHINFWNLDPIYVGHANSPNLCSDLYQTL